VPELPKKHDTVVKPSRDDLDKKLDDIDREIDRKHDQLVFYIFYTLKNSINTLRNSVRQCSALKIRINQLLSH
jgi:hypothetical protein